MGVPNLLAKMAKRDPNTTARNKAIAKLSEELDELLARALDEADRIDQQSINGFIGHKTEHFIDLKNDVIRSPEEFISKWLSGLQTKANSSYGANIDEMYEKLKNPRNENFRRYCELFLRRSFLKHYSELSKVRPVDQEAYFWFGINDAHFGLFVTPRFNAVKEEWENDKSEIRAFSKTYWTIGHVMETGLCFPGEDRRYTFGSPESYLQFCYGQVRLTKSIYQIEIAKRYCSFVQASTKPEQIPLLIPEIRYNHEGRKHEYRLDFLVVNPYTMDKIGFEFSPWSSHGQLSGKAKTLKELNEEARGNFEKEIRKIKSYFQKYNIYTLIYTDTDLQNIDSVWADISRYLSPTEPPVQLSLDLIESFLR